MTTMRCSETRTLIDDYLVAWDADELDYPWSLYDGEMELLDQFETEDEAIEAATELAQVEERDELIDEVQALVSDCEDNALLTQIRDLLKEASS